MFVSVGHNASLACLLYWKRFARRVSAVTAFPDLLTIAFLFLCEGPVHLIEGRMVIDRVQLSSCTAG